MKPAHALIAARHGVYDYDRYEALYAALWAEMEAYIDDDLVLLARDREPFLRRFAHPGAQNLPAGVDSDDFQLLDYTVHAVAVDLREFGYTLRVFWPLQGFRDPLERFKLAPVTIKKRERETLYYDPKGVPSPYWPKQGFLTFQVEVWRKHRYYFKK